MRRTLSTVAGFILAVGAPLRADVISTLDEWDGSRRTHGYSTVAEIVTVPADHAVLRSFRFPAYTETESGSYRVLVYEWNEALQHVVGPVLYVGASSPLTPGEFVLYEEPIGVSLTTERQYALIVDLSGGSEETGVGFVRLSVYDGYLAATNGPLDAPWLVFPTSDLAFEATFTSVTCPADLDQDGVVGFTDLLALLSAWGSCDSSAPNTEAPDGS